MMNYHVFKFAQWYNAAIDIIESKLYKPIPPKKHRPPPENTCSVFFHNKAVKLINLIFFMSQKF